MCIRDRLYTSSTFSKNKVCAIWHHTYPAGMAQVKRPIYCLLNTHPFYLSMHPQQGTDQFMELLNMLDGVSNFLFLSAK